MTTAHARQTFNAQLFPLRDWHPSLDWKSKNVLRAQPTGEFREPRTGEWFISGAIPEAYRASTTLCTKYHIARIVEVERVTTERIVRVM